MKKIKSFASLIAGITFLFFITLLGYASADVFQWTDEQGRTHFTDKIKKVPKRFRQDAEEKKQEDIPPIIIPEEPSKGDLDKKRKIVKKKRDKDFDEFKPRTDQGTPKGPLGIGFTGQQIDSDWIEVLNGGIKYIPTLGIGLTLNLFNKNKEPVWIKLQFGEGLGCRGGGKLESGESSVFSCRMHKIAPTRDYFIGIKVFNSAEASRKLEFPGRFYKPLETHTVEFNFGFRDNKKLDALKAEAKINRLGGNAFHGEIQSNWIEITSSTIKPRRKGSTQRPKYVLGLKLKNKTNKGIWVTVAFPIPDNPHKCTVTKIIPAQAIESFRCLRKGILSLNKDYPVEIKIYKNENDVKGAKFPKETLQTELRLED